MKEVDMEAFVFAGTLTIALHKAFFSVMDLAGIHDEEKREQLEKFFVDQFSKNMKELQEAMK